MSAVEGFAAVPNWMLRAVRRPSPMAVMVYAALASHQGAGGVYPARKTLAREAQCSVRSVAGALNELEMWGVLVRTRRTNTRGQATNGYELRPGGHLNPDEVRAPGAPTDDEVRAPGALGEGKQRQSIPLIEEEPLEEEPFNGSLAAADLFEEFWGVYPRKVARKASEAKWSQISEAGTDMQMVLDAAKTYAHDPNLPEKKFIPHPLTWLNQGRWDDEPCAPEAASSSQWSFAQQRQANMLGIVAEYRRKEAGHDALGDGDAFGDRALTAGR